MDTSINNEIVPAEEQLSQNEIARAIQLAGAAAARREMYNNEVALKGLYVDYVFNRLNLTKYR